MTDQNNNFQRNNYNITNSLITKKKKKLYKAFGFNFINSSVISRFSI